MVSFSLPLLAACGLSLFVPQDWPQFLGPNRDGVIDWPAAEAVLKDGVTKVAWRTSVGNGYGGAAIRDDQVFLLDRIGTAEDRLRVFAIADGKPLWQAGYPAEGRLSFKGSRTVPVVTSDQVFTAGGLGHVTAFSRETHEVLWSVNLEEDLGGERPMFGYSTNLLAVGDLVVAAVLGKETGLVAFEGATGKVRWKSEHAGYSHSSPMLAQVAGEEQILFLGCPEAASGSDQAEPSWIQGFDPTSGKLLWRYETTFARLPIPPPVQIDAERFFVTAGYRAGSRMVRVTKPGDEYKVEELFSLDRGSQIQSAVRHGDHLYMLANENWNQSRRRRAEGGLVCLDLDGKELWRTGDDPYFGRGALLLAGDTLLIQDGFNGVLHAVKASPDGFQPIASFDGFEYSGDDDEQIWAPMAYSDGYLVSRSHRDLVCVSLRER